MATREHDRSPEHFTWIVEGRSQNQKSTLRLYELVYRNETLLNGHVELHAASLELAGIAFSLWRAVFLSDTSGESADQTADLQKFLVSLVADNAVLYITDKNARNWSYRYYLDNALYRLGRLADERLKLSRKTDFVIDAASEKEEWLAAQNGLDSALERFAGALAEATGRSH